MTEVVFRRMDREVGTGQPGYRWAPGYLVVDPKTGFALYPPVDFEEAKRLARELHGMSTWRIE